MVKMRTDGQWRGQKAGKGSKRRKKEGWKNNRKGSEKHGSAFLDGRDLCEKAAVVQESWDDSGMLTRRL